MHADDTVPMWDVEMEGKTGHMCHVYVLADTLKDAETIASGNFPELELTGNTQQSG
jgi:hypothetical protein